MNNHIIDIKGHRILKGDWNALISEKRRVLRIAFCGRFKSGKTSLLNLLLGLDLPVKAVTATGTVTKIRYGIKDQVQLADGVRKIVSKQELHDFIRIKSKNIDGIVRSDAVTAYVGCQNGLMKNGNVEFWDTPGLDDDKELQKITVDAMKKCDVVIFVLDALQYLSASEKKFLSSRLKEIVGSNVIVVINRMDLLCSEGRDEIIESAQEDLNYLGNRMCGFGAVFTSASPTSPDIKELRRRIVKICENNKNRTKCINIAKRAKINSMAQKWRNELIETYNALNKIIRCETKNNKYKLEQLKLKYDSDKFQVIHKINLINCKINNVSYWENVLNTVKQEKEWEKNYSSLSANAMQQEMKNLFQMIRSTIKNVISSSEYPHCYPLPDINSDSVWQKMNWGNNFNSDNTKGMMAGIAAGATAGSVIPGVGTAVGAFAGFFIGMARDISKDSDEKTAFQNSCVNNTILEYKNEPSRTANEKVENFQEEILKNMEIDFNNQKNSTLNEIRKLNEQKNEVYSYIDMLEKELK